MGLIATIPELHWPQRSAESAPGKPSLASRFFDRLKASQMRRGEEAVARYIALHGDRVTDSLEREIERRFQEH